MLLIKSHSIELRQNVAVNSKLEFRESAVVIREVSHENLFIKD